MSERLDEEISYEGTEDGQAYIMVSVKIISIDTSLEHGVPLATQKGPVLPRSEVGPPKAGQTQIQSAATLHTNAHKITVDHGREGPSAHKGSNLSDRGSKTIILPSNGGWACL